MLRLIVALFLLAAPAFAQTVAPTIYNINHAAAWVSGTTYATGFPGTVVSGSPLKGFRVAFPSTCHSTDDPGVAYSGSSPFTTGDGCTWAFLSDVDFETISAAVATIPQVTCSGGNIPTKHFTESDDLPDLEQWECLYR